jgi:Domain of unknown function (DUF4352)
MIHVLIFHNAARLAAAAVVALAAAGCGSSAPPAATTTSPTTANPKQRALRWTVEGVRRAHRLGGQALPTRARHTFLIVKLRVRAERTTTLQPPDFVHLLDGSTEYEFSQPGFAALNASTGDHLFFDDTLRAGRTVHGEVVFDAPLHGPLSLEFVGGQRLALSM